MAWTPFSFPSISPICYSAASTDDPPRHYSMGKPSGAHAGCMFGGSTVVWAAAHAAQTNCAACELAALSISRAVLARSRRTPFREALMKFDAGTFDGTFDGIYICDTCRQDDKRTCGNALYIVCDECGHEACCSDGFTPMVRQGTRLRTGGDFCDDPCRDRARARGWRTYEEDDDEAAREDGEAMRRAFHPSMPEADFDNTA